MNTETLRDSYFSGKIILIDKPLNWTSFDVVNKVRWHLTKALKVKKIKVGHAGTLDPLASGLLVLCTGKATKMIEAFQDTPKTYIADVALGATTASYDLETPIEEQFSTNHITRALVEKNLQTFLGQQIQSPPVFSASKINGKPAYEYARKDIKVKMKTKKVDFHEIDLLKYEPKYLKIRISCSKGTYIRSFANDFGQKLKSGAYLSALRRTATGKFSIDDAWELQAYINKLDSM